MKAGRTAASRGRHLFRGTLVLVAIFASGLVTAGVVAGAGPLAILSDTTSTDTTSTDTTSTDSTDTTSTDTTETETTSTETTSTETTETDTTESTSTEPPPGGPCAQTGSEALSTDAVDYAPGSTAQISGAGFAPQCDVELRVTRPDSVTETLNTATDAAGEFLQEYLLPPPPGVIGDYRVDALGANGTVLASLTFADSRAVNAAALDGQAAVTVLPGATIPTSIRVTTASSGGSDDWESTLWTVGSESACEDHADHLSDGTFTESINITAPSTPGTYDVVLVAYDGDDCDGSQPSADFTLTSGVIVDDTILFTDRFGTAANAAVAGWVESPAGADCAIETVTPATGPTSNFANGYAMVRNGCSITKTVSTSGRSNVHLRYTWGQQTNNDASDDGDLIVQWKRSTDSSFLTVNTHDLANNSSTSPTSAVDLTLPGAANNTSIDVRFLGSTVGANDRGRVDNVIVSGTAAPANAPPVAVDDTYTTNEDSNLILDATTVGPNPSPVDNDTDADGHTLTVTAVGSASGGGVTLVAGVITFMPTPNLCGAGAGGFDYTVSDGNGGTDTGHVTVNLTCIDDPPTAANDSPTVGEDSGANVIDVLANDADIDGGPKTVTGVTQPSNGLVTNNGANVTYQPNPNYCNNGSPTDNFTYTINGGTSATVSVTVSCVDDAPVVAFTGGATSRNEGQSDTYTFSISDPDSSSFTYEAGYPKCGLGGSLQGTPTLGSASGSYVCSFPDGPASPTLAVIVRDGISPSNEATRPVTVANLPPMIGDVSVDSPIDEGESSTVTVSATDPAGSNDPLSYEFDCDGNGVYEVAPQPSNSHSCSYADDGSVTINVRVTDGDGGSDTASETVVVENLDPTITNVTAASPIDEGGSSLVTVTASDPAGVNDPLSYEFDCDGNSAYEVGPQSSNSHACSYSDNGSFTVKVRVTDGDGGEDSDTTSVQVDNVPPTIAISGAASVDESSSYTLSLGAVTDPGDDTVSSYVVHWGDGDTDPYSSNGDVTHTYDDGPNTYAVTVDLVDEDGTHADVANAHSVQVDNVPPTITNVAATSPIDEGESSLVTVTATDPAGVNDPLEYQFDCDGNSTYEVGPQSSNSHACSYADDGSFTVGVRVTDGDGGADTDSTTVVVENVAPTKPGKPTTSDPNPNRTGGFTLTWTASTDVPADTVTYLLEHKDANDAGYTTVASGIGSTSYTFGGANPVEAEGTWTYRVTASDEDGGVSDISDVSDPIKVDNSNPNAPSVAADRAPDYAGGGGWYKDTVTVTFTHNGDPALADSSAGSGVNPSSVAAPQTYITSGSHTKTGTVKDFAGNESASASLTVQVDKNDPTFGACVGGPFILGSGMQPVSITAADAGESGVNAGASTLAGSVDTSSIGAKNVLYTAVDNVGHSVTKTCSYSVVFSFHGFFQPVDNMPTMNRVNAGSAVPVKFDLSGDQGLNIFAAGYPKTKMISCTDSSPLDDIESTVTAGGSSLSYGNGQYVYVWKTEKSWAGQCRELDVLLVDGTMHSAKFRFK